MTTDVLEAVTFFTTCYKFGIAQAIISVSHMLSLIWSKVIIVAVLKFSYEVCIAIAYFVRVFKAPFANYRPRLNFHLLLIRLRTISSIELVVISLFAFTPDKNGHEVVMATIVILHVDFVVFIAQFVFVPHLKYV